MSNTSNDKLIERAYDLLEEITSHPSNYDTLLNQALVDNDLEAVKHWVSIIEGELAQESFANYEVY